MLSLRYGINPHQTPARVLRKDGPLPFTVRNGQPGYINLLDALNAWQLVRELKAATNLSAATSFKHVSPAGAAVAGPLSASLSRAYFVEDLHLSPVATAYARARGADRVSSYGDWVAVSDPVDLSLAKLLRREFSDGIIAPGFAPDALEILSHKRGGKFTILEIDPAFDPESTESREVFGVTFEQRRNDAAIGPDLLRDNLTPDRALPASAQRDLLVALVTLKYTQSNSVCLALDGQAIGVGAGQQSRIHCTRLAASKADTWWLRQHPTVLDLPFRDGLTRPERDNAIDGFLRDDLSPNEERLWQASFSTVPPRLTPAERRAWLDRLGGVSLGSDAFFPFRDSIDRAQRSGVHYVAQPGGARREDDVRTACDEYGMVLLNTTLRLFHH